jgi:hypothetical protein
MNLDKYIDKLFYEEFEEYDDYNFEWYDWEEKKPKKCKVPKYRYPKYPPCPKHHPQQCPACQSGQGLVTWPINQGCKPEPYCHIDKKERVDRTVIPYASGTSVPGANLSFPGNPPPGIIRGNIIGFGSNVDANITQAGGFIDLGTENNFAFIVPRNGCLENLEATFTVNTAPLNAQTATSATMPGTILTGCSNKINYPVCKGDRILLVYSAAITGAGPGDFNVIIGTASAGLSLALKK